MNALVSIDVATLTPATVFAPGGMEGIISTLEAEVRAIDRDISTPAGREAVKSLAYKVARSKTALDDMGKELVAGIKKQAGAIDADRKLARDRLDALKEEVRGPLTRWEQDELNRISAHEGALVAVIEAARQAAGKSSGLIYELINIVEGYGARDWQEFKERADVAVTEALATLNAALAVAEQREKDAAELEALRKEKAERDARDAADRQRIAQEQAEQERQVRREAEEKARLAQLEQWKAEQEARAKRDAEEAAARAVEQERARVAAEEARKAAEQAAQEAAERKRQENARHRKKIEKDVYTALLTHGINDPATAAHVVAVIAAGEIPHVSITY